jgi:hypothetical protein
MFSVFSFSPVERTIARIQVYNSTMNVSCEICGWMQPRVYDPDTMDYQSFATWPMMYPGEWAIRDVTLCRSCFELASNSSPNINNPEDMADTENVAPMSDDDFWGFDFERGREDEVQGYVPIQERPQLIRDLLDAVLLNVDALIAIESPSMDPVG